MRVTGGAVEEVAIRSMPQLDCIRPIGIGLVGSAAHVDMARRHLGIEPRRIECRVACRRDDPLICARHRANNLVDTRGDLGAEQLAFIRRAIHASDGSRQLAAGVHPSEDVARVPSACDVGEVCGGEGPPWALRDYSLCDFSRFRRQSALAALMRIVHIFFIRLTHSSGPTCHLQGIPTIPQ